MFPSFQVSRFPSFQGQREGGMEWGRKGGTMRGRWTDHVISGPMGGLKKLHPLGQTDKPTDMVTLQLNLRSGANSVKTSCGSI